MEDCAVSNIPEFIEKILQLRVRWYPADPTPEIWFRGTENRSFELLPGASWRDQYDEQTMVLSFRNMVPSYLNREPTDDWEWYYLMQHYGLPTRLLDWTENPLVALYFALLKEPSGDGPCVWVLDPVALNRLAQGFTDQTIIVPLSSKATSPSRYWLPEFCRHDEKPHVFEPKSDYRDNTQPLAVFPKRYNPRIVAQRGVFTIHGTERIPIEKIMTRDPSEPRIARFCFASEDRARLKLDLYALGLSKSSLFPEPQSVAEDLRDTYRTG